MDNDDFDLAYDEFTAKADGCVALEENFCPNPDDCNPIDILNAISVLNVGELIVDALKLTAYLRTQPIQTRYIGDLPFFTQFNNNRSFLNADLFFFDAYNVNYTKHCDRLSSYIALQEPSTVKIVQDVQPFVQKPISQALALASQFIMREIKLGFMFQGRKNFDNGLYVGFQLPFYYFIRHYNATAQTLSDLEQLNMFGSGGSGNSNGTAELIRKHLVGDRLGIGDLRIYGAYNLCEQDTFMATIGTLITLPIAASIPGVHYGRNFNNQTEPQFIDLLCFMCNLEKSNWQAVDQQATNFYENVLDWLSADLLTVPLGQEHRAEIGAFFEPQFNIQERITIKSRITGSYLFENRQHRFLLLDRDFSNLTTDIFDIFNADGDTISEEEAKNRFNYMQELLQEKFGPDKVNVYMSNRWKLQLTIMPELRLSDNWTCSLGFDWWWLQKEKIDIIPEQFFNHFTITTIDRNPPFTGIAITTNTGNFATTVSSWKAERPHAYQAKIFGGVSYKWFSRHKDLTFSLLGDYTLGNIGVARDFSLKAGLALTF
jgi:hypothetical protein